MRILVYDSSNQIKDSFISILITDGYEVVAAKDKKNILPMFGKRPFGVAIIGVEEDDAEMVEILEKIHYDDRFRGVNVIAHVSEPSREFMTNMIKMGVSGFLFKPFNEKDFLNRFHLLLEKANITPKKLKHITISNIDNLTLVFRHEGSKQILNGEVIEMSPIELKFIMPPGEAEMEVGHLIKNVSFNISAYKVTFSISITEKYGDEYKANFEDLSAFNAKLICKFLYDKYVEKL